ncbi:hypothetical protein jhhlp_005183 [Lomentospora prolificans]|uniref:Multiple RNA-binding domain-containing protein 1 n=1 Tax=Lomentospora prolificans TaxID=41688 RepID=A0A2N3N731_9PEZI|nr:hypothetical protein jhhlp_005183 [Lomentospora prolificans]
MASSRIFVKGLPSTITEQEFRNHFGANGRQITDVRIIPNRRIGYVGYKTPDEAASAVKYFNRTFIRMSKLAVEIARPIGDASLKKGTRTIGVPAAALNPSKVDTKQQDDAHSKKRKREVDESDPMLREFIRVMRPSSKKATGIDVDMVPEIDVPTQVQYNAGESDDEYEEIPSKQQHPKSQALETPQSNKSSAQPVRATDDTKDDADMQEFDGPLEVPAEPTQPATSKDATDDEWLRSRTNRLLDLLDDDEPLPAPQPTQQTVEPVGEVDTNIADVQYQNLVSSSAEIAGVEQQVSAAEASAQEGEDFNPDLETIRKTSRLFVRNLPYSTSEDDLRYHFEKFGTVEEVHLPVNVSGRSKGYALVLFADTDSAVNAFQASDGIPFQGRILHIVPAAAKRDNGLDEFAISKLPLKKQNLIRKRAEAASNSFNWNSLYMSQDAVNASIANRLGISKAELLDPTSADAGVKQAIAETTVIQETKAYFDAHGVDLNAFKSNKRGETAILVKNFPFGTTVEELRNMFEEHGTVLQVLMPPSGTIAIIQFAQPGHAKAAFAKLAYRRIRDSILFLEKAPKDIFLNTPAATPVENLVPTKDTPSGGQKLSVAELLERGDEQAVDAPTTSLYVRNLNFATTTEELANAFSSLDGFVSARVKTKTDSKKPGQILSMGFGFVEFRTKPQAMAAIKAMDGAVLAGHTLAVKASHRGLDAAEERRRQDAAKKLANMRTKIVIKNLPFEATKNDVRALFSTHGELRAVRVPKKFNHQSRGFAFAEFVTPREAENAVSALKDTHLLGRKLVIDFAEAETIDPEEEIARMQKKVGGQVNKVAIQQLANRGRTKVNIGNTEDDMEL